MLTESIDTADGIPPDPDHSFKTRKKMSVKRIDSEYQSAPTRCYQAF